MKHDIHNSAPHLNEDDGDITPTGHSVLHPVQAIDLKVKGGKRAKQHTLSRLLGKGYDSG